MATLDEWQVDLGTCIGVDQYMCQSTTQKLNQLGCKPQLAS
jgi:hypothetical protein